MNVALLTKGLALGAAAMYLFDPDRGRERRTQLADQTREQLQRKKTAVRVMKDDFGQKVDGWKHEMQHREGAGKLQVAKQQAKSMANTPSASFLLTLLGLGMALKGAARRDFMGGIWAVAGLGLTAKALADTEKQLGDRPLEPLAKPVAEALESFAPDA